MTAKRKALILVNIGTPEKPDKSSVRRYLKQFLNDKRVIDLPWLLRKILVNIIIIPFRVRKSTALYKRLWTDEGSPLLVYNELLAEKIKDIVKANTDVYTAMRYGNPALEKLLKDIATKNYEKINVFPLFPQYAESTTGSVVDIVRKISLENKTCPEPVITQQFWYHPAFIDSFVENIRSYSLESYDYIVFSYHGLPIRQIKNIHSGHSPQSCLCETAMPEWGKKCYKATCYATTRALVKKLSLEKVKYSTAFQSRLTRNWLSPFTDDIIKRIACSGIRKVLVIAPSFVIDCLETIIEIEQDYKQLFIKHGGKELTLVKSLNDSTQWARAITIIASVE